MQLIFRLLITPLIFSVLHVIARYQMDIERLSQLQDIIDKFNAANTADQRTILQEIIDFIVDDYRQILLAPHKRMDIVVPELLMTGKAQVHLADNKENIELLDIELPFHFLQQRISLSLTCNRRFRN